MKTPPWLRLHRRVRQQAKVQRLSDAHFRAWVNLLCSTDDEGVLPADLGDLAFELRLSETDLETALAALVAARLFVKREDGRFIAHDWSDWQHKSDVSTERVRKHRERQKAVSETAVGTGSGTGETVSGTPPDTETDQNRSDTQAAGACADADFDRFWDAFEHRLDASKPLALAAWNDIADRPPIDDLLEAVAGYRAFLAAERVGRKPGVQGPPLMHAANWLRERRFDAFIAARTTQDAAVAAQLQNRLAKIPEGGWRDTAQAFAKAHGWPLWDGVMSAAKLDVEDDGKTLVIEFDRHFSRDFAEERGVTAKIATVAAPLPVVLRVKARAPAAAPKADDPDPLEIPAFCRRDPEPKEAA